MNHVISGTSHFQRLSRLVRTDHRTFSQQSNVLLADGWVLEGAPDRNMFDRVSRFREVDHRDPHSVHHALTFLCDEPVCCRVLRHLEVLFQNPPWSGTWNMSSFIRVCCRSPWRTICTMLEAYTQGGSFLILLGRLSCR